MLNRRENYLAVMNQEKADFMPCYFTDVHTCGGALETFENGPAGGGEDGFGCRWQASTSANGQASLEANHQVLSDVTLWKEVVKFPDLDAYDWEEEAKKQLCGYDPENQIIEYQSWNSQFLRLTHLMGFEDGLCALALEPEACYDLMEAITDYKIRLIERAAHYFHPDVFCNFDDVATATSPFLSHDSYEKLIKPHHKRMNDAAKAYGMLPQQHCCGNCESLIPDFMDEGSVAWQCAQPCNDIAGLLEKYGDRFTIIGGYDTQGAPGQLTATDEIIQKELDRCFSSYGKYGRSYMFFGFILGPTGDAVTEAKGALIAQEAIRRSADAWK